MSKIPNRQEGFFESKEIKGDKQKLTSQEIVKAVRDCRTRMRDHTTKEREELEKEARKIIESTKNKNA